MGAVQPIEVRKGQIKLLHELTRQVRVSFAGLGALAASNIERPTASFLLLGKRVLNQISTQSQSQ